jgi:hypothetical protein
LVKDDEPAISRLMGVIQMRRMVESRRSRKPAKPKRVTERL